MLAWRNRANGFTLIAVEIYILVLDRAYSLIIPDQYESDLNDGFIVFNFNFSMWSV